MSRVCATILPWLACLKFKICRLRKGQWMSMDDMGALQKPLTQEDEIALCRKARGGDDAAFGALRAAFEERARQLVTARLPAVISSGVDAAVQRVFWKTRTRLRSASGAPKDVCEQRFHDLLAEVAEGVIDEVILCWKAQQLCLYGPGLEKLREEGRTASETLVASHYGPLLGHIRARIFGDLRDQTVQIEDLVQETFTRAIAKLGGYEIEYGFSQHLRNFAKYVILEHVSDRWKDAAIRASLPSNMKSIVALEYLRLVFLSPAEPHQMAAKAHSLLGWSPLLLARDRRWTQPLGELVTVLRQDMHQHFCSPESPQSFYRNDTACLCRDYFHTCEPISFRDGFRVPVASAYAHPQVGLLLQQGFQQAHEILLRGRGENRTSPPAKTKE